MFKGSSDNAKTDLTKLIGDGLVGSTGDNLVNQLKNIMSTSTSEAEKMKLINSLINVKVELPQINSIIDVSKYKQQIIDYVENNKDSDHVYHLNPTSLDEKHQVHQIKSHIFKVLQGEVTSINQSGKLLISSYPAFSLHEKSIWHAPNGQLGGSVYNDNTMVGAKNWRVPIKKLKYKISDILDWIDVQLDSIKDYVLFIAVSDNEDSISFKNNQLGKLLTILQDYTNISIVYLNIPTNENINNYFNDPKIEKSGILRHDDWCIAGSKALETFIKHFANKELFELNQNTLIKIESPIKSGHFIAQDTDIFFLNSTKRARYDLNTTDIVYVTDRTIEELILNFDLPCCRIAMNTTGDYWISIQCLYALMTGKYYIPTYLKNKKQFDILIEKYPGDDFKKLQPKNLQNLSNYLFQRLAVRIDKYHKRGFVAIEYKTDVILRWIINRFNYSEPTKLFGEEKSGIPITYKW